jgi:hypothetical protein
MNGKGTRNELVCPINVLTRVAYVTRQENSRGSRVWLRHILDDLFLHLQVQSSSTYSVVRRSYNTVIIPSCTANLGEVFCSLCRTRACFYSSRSYTKNWLVEVTLRLTVSQSVSFGVEPQIPLGLETIFYCLSSKLEFYNLHADSIENTMSKSLPQLLLPTIRV